MTNRLGIVEWIFVSSIVWLINLVLVDVESTGVEDKWVWTSASLFPNDCASYQLFNAQVSFSSKKEL